MSNISCISKFSDIITNGKFTKRQFNNISYNEAQELIKVMAASVKEPTIEIILRRHDRAVDVVFISNDFNLPPFNSYPISLIGECIESMKADTQLHLRVNSDGLFYMVNEEEIDIMETVLKRQAKQYFQRDR